jgi:hypothetical protein
LDRPKFAVAVGWGELGVGLRGFAGAMPGGALALYLVR